ncbi:Shedu anti-phage system protein SduA domain-containing protein [Limnoraphis robusta CCNP1324]|uniref:Shedu anti-phage system protein SduA domain-containing protein n=1 Tax=Limnoraphis robusta TaxID=1118279 RepID=UPI002B200CCA|nr:Shedu anti-phage system protein SduA domain-containing protein [Limnoraphis robusta]MEA5547613.1 Shedu anti-phage system protein SduA domain-containing protein [Limnoraphis robusta CCNP1324]
MIDNNTTGDDSYFSDLLDSGDNTRNSEVFSDNDKYSCRFQAKLQAQGCGWINGFSVKWMEPSKDSKLALTQALDRDCDENEAQRVLETHPLLLARHLRGGHGRWVIPKTRLGSEFATDFLMCEASSVGLQWYAVELESPKHNVFTMQGDPTAQLTHAMRQIHNWRDWLRNNRDYAARPKDNDGLGLIDIDCDIQGLIVIGRRNDARDQPKLRRRYITENKIAIHSYDWLAD